MSPKWIQRLQDRWHVKSAWQVMSSSLSFLPARDFTVMFIKPVITEWLFHDNHPGWFSVLYWVLILPIYNLFLLFYGFVFGQFKFFWAFEKRFFSRIVGRRSPR
jgi:hypothetical protein